MFVVTLYCHDRNETLYQWVFDTFAQAHSCAVEQAKLLVINTSIRLSDFY